MLQQYLPLAVLKPINAALPFSIPRELQQYLPLAVLKPFVIRNILPFAFSVATVLTACGIETLRYFLF